MSKLSFALIAIGGLAMADTPTKPDTVLGRKQPLPPPVDPDAPPDILIGAFLSMTGPNATFGISTSNGIALAVEEVNAKGGVHGRKVVVKTLDTMGRANYASSTVWKLITQDRVTALLGEVSSSLSLEDAAIAQRHGIPMITPASTNAKVTELGGMITRACFVDSFQGFVMAKFARTELKLSRVATLIDRTGQYSSEVGLSFEKEFVKLGGKIASARNYASGDQDWKAQLEAIRDAKADAIFIPGYYVDVGPIAAQVRAMGLTVKLLGGDGWDSPQLAQLGGAAIDGAYYVNHFAVDDKLPIVKQLVANYQAKYNELPDGLAALGYDAARLLFDAMERAPPTAATGAQAVSDLAAAIRSTKNFDGVTGTITIDRKGNTRKSAVVMQLLGGRPVHVATVQP